MKRNNQTRLAGRIFHAIKNDNEDSLVKLKRLYDRYTSYIGKESTDENLLTKVNLKYANYMVNKYASFNELFDWTKEDGKDLEKSIEEDLFKRGD